MNRSNRLQSQVEAVDPRLPQQPHSLGNHHAFPLVNTSAFKEEEISPSRINSRSAYPGQAPPTPTIVWAPSTGGVTLALAHPSASHRSGLSLDGLYNNAINQSNRASA